MKFMIPKVSAAFSRQILGDFVFYAFRVLRLWEVSWETLLPSEENIATGETSQAITPFHFFDIINFHH